MKREREKERGRNGLTWLNKGEIKQNERWTLRRSREKTWKPERKTTKALVSRLSFYRCMLKMFLGDAMDHWGSFNIPFHFVQ